jgi:hypothetical protein
MVDIKLSKGIIIVVYNKIKFKNMREMIIENIKPLFCLTWNIENFKLVQNLMKYWNKDCFVVGVNSRLLRPVTSQSLLPLKVVELVFDNEKGWIEKKISEYSSKKISYL